MRNADNTMSTPPNQQASGVTLRDLLAAAIRAHQAGNLDAAEPAYHRVLELLPEHPDALHFLGVLRHQRGDSATALELTRRGIAVAPNEPGFHNNLGNVLVETGRAEEALAAYQQVLKLAPDHADVHNNLGSVLRTLGRLDESEATYRRALDLDPQHVEAHTNFGALLAARGRPREAVEHFFRAITLSPARPEARKLLGIACYSLGELDMASQVYRDRLREQPDSPVAKHHLAACTGQDVPARAADDYVEKTFDAFAESFDAKLGHLGYRAPQLVADAVARHCGEARATLDILDAGCGTGLCGPLLKPWAATLRGVDLSGQMLARAQLRKVYDALVREELTADLQAQREVFDLIVSADTLVYFGALEAVLGASNAALRERGKIVFTIEENDVDSAEHRINPHGRYSHSRNYVQRALADAGFAVTQLEPAVLRNEGG